MKKLMTRLLVLILVITVLPLSALASLENHNVPDVTIAKSEGDNNYYFPDIVKLNDGKLLVCYYQAAAHVAEGSYGAIYLTESSDNGKTWSEPWKVIDRSADSKDSRDPNLTVLPDGTVILTYFGGGDCRMRLSQNGGHSWYKEIKVKSDILDISVSKRGTIAVIDNDNILVPVYGKSSGDNAYGAPATATGTNQFGSGWQVDAAVLHYQRQADGNWKVVFESMLGQSIDETGLLFTGNGGDVTVGEDGYPVYEGDVWAFSREDGSVRVSHDNCRTWQLMAKEEPRQYTTKGEILWGEQILQPRFTKISDDCWFVTYANYTHLNYTHDRISRPVYGKVFFPEQGWYATQSRVIFDGVGHGIQDMADPASVITEDGKVLIVYYSTTLQTISGTFTDLEDWVTVNDVNEGPQTVVREFWPSSMSSLDRANSVFSVSCNTADDVCWTAVDGGLQTNPRNDHFPEIISHSSLSGDYTAQFDFAFKGVADDAVVDKVDPDRDEGLYIIPLNNVADTAGGLKYRIRLSPDSGAQLIYGSNRAGDYSGVLAGSRKTASEGLSVDTLPASFEESTIYTIKYAREGDTLSIKVWEAGKTEPAAWQCVYTDETIDVTTPYYFALFFRNKGADEEVIFLANAKFTKPVTVMPSDGIGFKEGDKWNFANQGKSDFDGLVSLLIFNQWDSVDGGHYTNKNNRTMTYKKNISGQYKARFEFTLDGSAGNSTDGLWVYPLYGSNNPNITGAIKFRITTNNGIQAYCGDSIKSGVVKENVSLKAGVAYNAKVSKDYDTLSLKIWQADTAEPLGWNMVWMDSAIGNKVNYDTTKSYDHVYDHSRHGEGSGNGKPYNWKFHLVNASASNTHGVTIRHLELYKNVVMELNHTELTVGQGEMPKNIELNTTFYPNIFQQLPTPTGKVQYTSSTGCAATSAISHVLRPHRANVAGVSVGKDVIVAAYPGIVDAEGNAVKAVCEVTVVAPNTSNELKAGEEGYVTEVIYEQDFENVELFENSAVDSSSNYTLADVNYNPMGDFFEYRPFYNMSHLGTKVDEEGNRCLKSYVDSGSQHAGSRMISLERIRGDLTLEADILLPAYGAEARFNVASQQDWYVPEGEAAAGSALGSVLSASERQKYVDYQINFRTDYIATRMNSGFTLHMAAEDNDSENTNVWMSVKVIKAGDTLYAKSWPKGTAEPDWETIVKDERLLAADRDLGGSYISIELNSGYTNKNVYSTDGEVLMDNLRITRQVAPKRAVVLDADGGIIAEGKNITEYTEGQSVALPKADEITKEGYNFLGWYDNETFEGKPVEEIPATATGDLTYYAKWEAVEEPEEPEIPEEPEEWFTDVADTNKYYEAVKYVAANDLMGAIVANRFGTNYAAYRATVVATLWGMENEPAADHEMSFTDVSGKPYTEAIRWANANGIVNGVSSTKFSPMAELTKEQLLTILYRYAAYKDYNVSAGTGVQLQFTDASSVSAYAKDAVKWACGVGIIDNNSEALLPRKAVIRGDFAEILMNFCQTVAK